MKLKPNKDRTEYRGTCDKCGKKAQTYRGIGDFIHECGAIYNAFGQRLRDNLYSNSDSFEWDDDYDEMTSYEITTEDY